MKLGPKEIKVVNQYLIRPVKNRLKEIFEKKSLPQLQTADEIKQPPVRKDVEDMQAVNEFMKRNPRADGGRIPFGKAGFVISDNKQKSKLKFTKKQDDLAEKVYGKSMKELYKTNRTLFGNVRRGLVKETTQAGKGVKVKGNIQIPTKDVRQPDGKIKKIELPVRYPNKKVEKNFKKAVRNIFKKPAGNIPFKTLAKDFPITERQATRAAKQIKKEEGLEYAKGRGKTEYIKEVREPLIKKTDSPRVLKRIAVERARFLKDKPEVFGKIDTAHRASKSHMARLGLEFDTQLVGMDSRLINQVVLKPAENMLDKLYERREDILDNLKGKPTKEQKKILQEINDSVKKVVKTTSGRFVGIIVDPNTLEPSFSGIKKNLAFSKVNKTMKEIEKLPGAPAVTGGFPGNMKDNEYFKFIKDNVQKSVSGEIKKGFVPNDFKVILSDPKNRKNLLDYAKKNAPDILPQFKKVLDNPTSKQSLALFANPLFSPGILKEAFKTIPTPAGAVGLNLGFGVDPTSAIDRASIAAEAAFAPQLVKQSAKFGPVAQRFFNLGLSPALAARVARVASPLGIASLIGEATIAGAKNSMKEANRIDSIKDPNLQSLEFENFIRNIKGFADGGLSGGDKSGPPPESGPTPHGDEGLPGIFKRVKKQ